jgi:hypothetical protein
MDAERVDRGELTRRQTELADELARALGPHGELRRIELELKEDGFTVAHAWLHVKLRRPALPPAS